MPAAFDLVTIDVVDTERAARFWSAALDLHEIEREDGGRWIALADAGERRVLGLQRGSHRRGGTHIDLACLPAEFDDELARLIALGATAVGPARREPYGSIANLADPEGNPFDLCAYV
jgi:predicted enzyme related to lactoylglutathione lyase